MRLQHQRSPTAPRRDWVTPGWLYEYLSDEYGPFDLDAATTERNPLGTRLFYTPRDDAMKWPWPGRVYLNPPYGPPLKGAPPEESYDIAAWMRKAREETITGGADLVCCLVPARFSRWFHDNCWEASEILFPDKRINYVDPSTGLEVKGTPFDSMVVVFRRGWRGPPAWSPLRVEQHLNRPPSSFLR